MPTTDLIKPILSEQEAAIFLNVSEPFLVKQLERAKLPYRNVGAYRCVELAELVTFKRSMHLDTSAALQELATQAQELGLGY